MMPLSGTLCTVLSALAIPEKDDAITSETAAVEQNLAIRVIMNDSPRCKCRCSRGQTTWSTVCSLRSNCVQSRSLGVLDLSQWTLVPYSKRSRTNRTRGGNDVSVARALARSAIIWRSGFSPTSRVGLQPDLHRGVGRADRRDR